MRDTLWLVHFFDIGELGAERDTFCSTFFWGVIRAKKDTINTSKVSIFHEEEHIMVNIA